MRSLAFKLILAFLLVSLTGTALVVILAGQTTASEFGHFVLSQNQETLVTLLTDYYRARGSWAGVDNVLRTGGMGMGGRGMGAGGGFTLADVTGRVVVGGAGHRTGEQLSQTELASGAPIRVEGTTVGILVAGRSASAIMSTAEAEFLSRVNLGIVIASLGATLVALLLGVWLSRRLTRPVRELTAATQAVAKGDLGHQVESRSRDELGELAESFNRMSADLAHARDQRRQMTADIAHDLRTPLSVILGHSEALRDGVIQPTSESLNLVHDEALRLNRLVEDLRTLSLAEAGELPLTQRRADVDAMLERAAASQSVRAQQQGIALRTEIAAGLPDVYVDPDRMAQVFANLLDNALRHTPAGGSVTLSAVAASGGVRLVVRDTGPGIASDDLPRVFERFYRADKSRRRDQGGSGLGLAIAKSIIESHGGRIWAESSPGAGTQFIIELPTAR